MRFFHLADLHIGKVVHGYSLLEDQRHILAQVVEHTKQVSPDAVLIAGDVYDKAIPGEGAVALFDDFLTALSETGAQILVTCGNHDSPERLGFAGRLLSARGVHIAGRYDGALHTVTLHDAHGPCHIHMLPFIKPAHVRAFYPDADIPSYEAAVREALAHHAVDSGARNVLMAHQFVVAQGISPERSDSEVDPVGGLSSVDASLFDAFDYVALGHLHGPQRVGRETVRYAGSPLKYSFSECHQQKRLALVTLGPLGDEPEIAALPLSPLHDMRRIRGPIDRLTDPATLAGADAQDYIHATLTDPGEVTDALPRLRACYPNLMALAFDNERTRLGDVPIGDAPDAEQSPLSLFAEFYAAQNGEPPSPAHLAAMEALLAATEDI